VVTTLFTGTVPAFACVAEGAITGVVEGAIIGAETGLVTVAPGPLASLSSQEVSARQNKREYNMCFMMGALWCLQNTQLYQ
jgi:hypothetical protein